VEQVKKEMFYFKEQAMIKSNIEYQESSIEEKSWRFFAENRVFAFISAYFGYNTQRTMEGS